MLPYIACKCPETTHGVPFRLQVIMTNLYVTTGRIYANNMITSFSALGLNDKI